MKIFQKEDPFQNSPLLKQTFLHFRVKKTFFSPNPRNPKPLREKKCETKKILIKKNQIVLLRETFISYSAILVI